MLAGFSGFAIERTGFIWFFIGTSLIGLPVALLALFVWLIAGSSHVLKSALEWSVPACVGLVILEILSNELLQISLLPIPH